MGKSLLGKSYKKRSKFETFKLRNFWKNIFPTPNIFWDNLEKNAKFRAFRKLSLERFPKLLITFQTCQKSFGIANKTGHFPQKWIKFFPTYCRPCTVGK